MEYFVYEKSLIIRDMTESDAESICNGEIEQGWQADIGKYKMRLEDAKKGISVALTAEYNGNAAGYINVYFHQSNQSGLCEADFKKAEGPFADSGYPEIADFGVLEKYRHLGIGSRLMDAAEKIAGKISDTVFLGVGLHSGYGSAQRMYVKRGYIPDGSGVWYNGKVAEPYSDCKNDDDLILYMSKKLR